MSALEQGALIWCVGCTGLIGQELVAALLAADYRVIVSSRSPTSQKYCAWAEHVTWHSWPNPMQELPEALPETPSAVINLAGANVGQGRWTQRRKKILRDSRILVSQHVAQVVEQLSIPLWLNASGVSVYPQGDTPCDEISAPTNERFLAQLVQDWEAPVQASSARWLCLRTAVVLSSAGGALGKLYQPPLPIVTLGSGKQHFAWIHIADVIGLMMQALRDQRWHGVVNAAAPESCTLSAFNACLSRVSGTWRAPLNMPSWCVRLLIGEFAEELLGGCPVVPARAQEHQYPWQYPELAGALASCLAKEDSVDG